MEKISRKNETKSEEPSSWQPQWKNFSCKNWRRYISLIIIIIHNFAFGNFFRIFWMHNKYTSDWILSPLFFVGAFALAVHLYAVSVRLMILSSQYVAMFVDKNTSFGTFYWSSVRWAKKFFLYSVVLVEILGHRIHRSLFDANDVRRRRMVPGKKSN